MSKVEKTKYKARIELIKITNGEFEPMDKRITFIQDDLKFEEGILRLSIVDIDGKLNIRYTTGELNN